MSYQQRLDQKYKAFVSELSQTPPVPCDFKVGDVVTFTNEFGVEFEDRTVMGFASNAKFHGRFIHLGPPTDAYWFPCRPNQLKVQSK